MVSDQSDGDLPAGDFASWLSAMQAALLGEVDSQVPCGGCNACCTASQFVPIGPDETDTLARIPGELLFPAPRRPKGHFVLGYGENGHCPMLVDSRCSIYEHRPRTCRAYDCRIFAATGLEVDAEADTKVEIAARVRRWRFSFPTAEDHRRHAAVQVAVRSAHLPSITEVATRAIETHEEFLDQVPGRNR